jgi:hypothetical protein
MAGVVLTGMLLGEHGGTSRTGEVGEWRCKQVGLTSASQGARQVGLELLAAMGLHFRLYWGGGAQGEGWSWTAVL